MICSISQIVEYIYKDILKCPFYVNLKIPNLALEISNWFTWIQD